MDGTDGNDAFTFTRGITEFSTTATKFETVNVEEVFVNSQGGIDVATVFSTERSGFRFPCFQDGDNLPVKWTRPCCSGNSDEAHQKLLDEQKSANDALALALHIQTTTKLVTFQPNIFKNWYFTQAD